MEDHLFDIEKAQKLLPDLERWLQTAIHARKLICEIESEYTALVKRIFLMGGKMVDVSHFAERRKEKETSEAVFQEAMQSIHECGCVVKDLEVGLIDFPCRMGDKEVYLCWKLGEPTIRYWHSMEDGFSGRKLIDEKFVAKAKRSPFV